MTRNDLLATAGETLAYAEDYLDTRIELVKLEVADKSTRAAAGAITGAIIGVLAFFAAICLVIALAIWIGSLLGRPALGFLLVGVLFLVIAGVVFLVKDKLLTQPILRSLIKKLFDKKSEDRPHEQFPTAA